LESSGSIRPAEPVAAYQGICFSEQFGRQRLSCVPAPRACVNSEPVSPHECFSPATGRRDPELARRAACAEYTAVLDFLRRSDAVAWVLHPSLTTTRTTSWRGACSRAARLRGQFRCPCGRARREVHRSTKAGQPSGERRDARTLVIHPASTTINR